MKRLIFRLNNQFYISTIIAFTLIPSIGLTEELNSGDTAWMLTASALVLFMTIPGLALFMGV